MKIGILGAGNIGSTAARLFAAAGHEIALSHSRSPKSLEGKVSELGAQVHALSAEEAAVFGEMLLVAIPFKAVPSLGSYSLGGRVLIDATNYYPERDGSIDFKGRTSSELLEVHARDGRVVKAFNTMWFKTLGSEGKPRAPLQDRLTLFIAGDDAGAKIQVSRLIEEIGFAPLDTGPLARSARQEPGSPIYNKPMNLAAATAALR